MSEPIIYYSIKEIYGTDLSSTKLAYQFYQDILEEIDLGFNIEIDFKDVRSLSPGWIRNAFGIMIKNHGEEFFKNHIKIINANKNIKEPILKSIKEVLI
jgi:hypothetical protein